MALFGINTKGKSPKLGGGWDVLSQAIQRMWSKTPKRDVADLPELFHKNPRLSPVAAIARAVASTPYELYSKADYKKNKDAAIPIVDHEVLDLLDMPIKRYPEIDGYFMFYTIEALTKLVGEAYLLKVRDDAGRVIELDIIPPMWVTSVPSVTSPYFIVYPYGTTAARSLTVSPDDMITFRRPNLSDPYGRGRGDSEPLEQEFISDENMASMQSNFAYNDATPPYIITAPGMPQDQADAFKKSWMQKLGGIGHRREPGVLGFDAKVQMLGMSPVELDMIESRKFIRDMSSEHYQIPPEILGRIEHCHDEDTECLTLTGWKKYNELTLNDEIATWNIDSKKTEFQKPTEISVFNHDGPMHHWAGRRIDVLVTPGHRMLRMDKFGKWEYKTSDSHSAERGWFKWLASGDYEGGKDIVTLPQHIYKRATRRPSDTKPTILNVSDFAYFLGAYISEGYVSKVNGVWLAQNEGPIADKMIRSLEALNLSPVHIKRGINDHGNKRCEPYITHGGLSAWLRENVKDYAENKRIPQECFDWSRENKLRLLEGLMDGDGSIKNGYCNYGTASKLLADDLQRLCVSLGFVSSMSHRVNHSPCNHDKICNLWTVIFRFEPNKKSGLSNTVSVGDYCSDGLPPAWMHEEYYNGKVWCVTVPNGNFYTRRNGKIVCHGNSNRATINSAFYLYNKNVLSYEYGFIERVLTRQLIVTDFDKNLILKFDPDVPEDEEHKLQVFSAGLTGGVIQIDEWRKAFDLPELPDGKGKVFLRSFSTYEVPSNGSTIVPPTTSASPAEGTEDAPTDDELIDEKPIEEASKAIFAMIQKSRELEDVKKKTITIVSNPIETKASKNKARREAIWKAFDSRATAKEGMFIEVVKKYAEGQKSRVVSALDSSAFNTAIESGKGYDKAIKSALDSVFNDKANKALKSALAPAWIASMVSGREHFYDMIGGEKAIKAPKVKPSLEVTNSLFNSWVESNGLLKAEGINDTTNDKLRKKLNQTISDAISNGDTLNTIKNSILDVCDSVYYDLGADTNLDAAYRAKLIGRNETMQSVNFGNHTTMKVEGIQKREWLSVMGDGRTRDAHADADGQVVGIDEPFIVDNEPLDYPGDSQHGSAENTISCRCTETAVMIDEGEEE